MIFPYSLLNTHVKYIYYPSCAMALKRLDYMYFPGQILYSVVLFVYVVLLLFQFSILFGIVLGNVSYDLLSLVVHRDSSYYELAISISVGLLLLVVACYRSAWVLFLYLISSYPDSGISMLLNVLSYWSTCLALYISWLYACFYELMSNVACLLSSHWFLIQLVQLDTYEWLVYMNQVGLGSLLLIFLLLHSILLPLKFLFLV